MEKRKRLLVFAVVIAFIVIASVYLSFLPVKCKSYECFRVNMAECNPATFINEEKEASWGYEIIGPNVNTCKVEVTLLQAKEGELSLLDFEGNNMNCYYDRGLVAYPEEDLASCTGLLKENLQERIIQKLHEYIVDNLGSVKTALSE